MTYKVEPIVGISPDGKEYLFKSVYIAFSFVRGYKSGKRDSSKIHEYIRTGGNLEGWTFRYLDDNEKDYYEKVLRSKRGKEYGADPRPESGTSDSGE
jgi:hypothetical protein